MGDGVRKEKRESLKQRLQHGENAWVAASKSFNEQFAQLFGYVLRLEKRIDEQDRLIAKMKRMLRHCYKKLN